jgi:hypothetical protein
MSEFEACQRERQDTKHLNNAEPSAFRRGEINLQKVECDGESMTLIRSHCLWNACDEESQKEMRKGKFRH